MTVESTNYFPVLHNDIHRMKVHNEKVTTLETLALLLGCYSNFFSELPDGKKPDVLRYNANKNILFIGDAKNTETPSNQYTQKRLHSYLLWFSAYVSQPNKTGIFAICFTNPIDLNGWRSTIRHLADIACIDFLDFSFKQIDDETNLLWFICSS